MYITLPVIHSNLRENIALISIIRNNNMNSERNHTILKWALLPETMLLVLLYLFSSISLYYCILHYALSSQPSVEPPSLLHHRERACNVSSFVCKLKLKSNWNMLQSNDIDPKYNSRVTSKWQMTMKKNKFRVSPVNVLIWTQ